MEAILASIQPQHASNILNLIKLWEIRKRFPKDYVGWVYIYVTKGKGHYCYHAFESDAYTIENARFIPMTKCNGKVVARFWCDRVEEIWTIFGELSPSIKIDIEKTCLTKTQIEHYLGDDKVGYAIHITKLEIFDKPKEISEFYKVGFEKEYNQAVFCLKNNVRWKTEPDYVIEDYRLTRAPQSWCYIEV